MVLSHQQNPMQKGFLEEEPKQPNATYKTDGILKQPLYVIFLSTCVPNLRCTFNVYSFKNKQAHQHYASTCYDQPQDLSTDWPLTPV